MFSMRHFMTIADSYNDETDSVDAKRVETNINLEIGDFAEENDTLAKYSTVPDTKYANSIGSEIIKAIKEYTGGSEINGALIEVDGNGNLLPSALRQQYQMLMRLQNKVPLQEEHHTYSGTGAFNPMEITVDGIFSTPTFLSTSLSVKVAVKTTNYRRDDSAEDHVLHFILPEGFSGGFYISPYSTDPEELEYLLFPKERFRHLNSNVVVLDDIKRHIHSFKPI